MLTLIATVAMNEAMADLNQKELKSAAMRGGVKNQNFGMEG
jgi:hypothetical protein